VAVSSVTLSPIPPLAVVRWLVKVFWSLDDRTAGVRVSFIYPFWSVICLSQPSYERNAVHCAALERLGVTDAGLTDVAAGALGMALFGGWHGTNLANGQRSHWVEHRAAHLPCSRSLRRSAHVFPFRSRSGHALSDDTL